MKFLIGAWRECIFSALIWNSLSRKYVRSYKISDEMNTSREPVFKSNQSDDILNCKAEMLILNKFLNWYSNSETFQFNLYNFKILCTYKWNANSLFFRNIIIILLGMINTFKILYKKKLRNLERKDLVLPAPTLTTRFLIQVPLAPTSRSSVRLSDF